MTHFQLLKSELFGDKICIGISTNITRKLLNTLQLLYNLVDIKLYEL